MKKPDDLLTISKILFEEFRSIRIQLGSEIQ